MEEIPTPEMPKPEVPAEGKSIFGSWWFWLIVIIIIGLIIWWAAMAPAPTPEETLPEMPTVPEEGIPTD